MEFDKTNKVIIDSLNSEEAKVFIKFLESEIKRHYRDIQEAKKLITEIKAGFGFGGIERERIKVCGIVEGGINVKLD